MVLIWFTKYNFFHCHESVTLIHAVFETLIAIHIFQRFFGIIPQSNGADDHPTPNQFLYVYRLLSVSNLVKPGKRMNVESKPGDILLTIQKLQQQPTPFVPQIEILIDEILIQDSCSSYDQSDVAEHAYNVSSPRTMYNILFRCYVAHHITTVAVQSTYALRVSEPWPVWPQALGGCEGHGSSKTHICLLSLVGICRLWCQIAHSGGNE